MSKRVLSIVGEIDALKQTFIEFESQQRRKTNNQTVFGNIKEIVEDMLKFDAHKVIAAI